VRGHEDDGPVVAQGPQPRRQQARRLVVESRERLVEQDEPRAVQERALNARR
jgi:hypothetical protein